MQPDELEGLKEDLKDLKQARMAVGLGLIVLRRLGLGSTVGTALKCYLGPGAFAGGALGHAVMQFRPDLLPGFTLVSSTLSGLVLGAVATQLLRGLGVCLTPLRFYARLLEARILYGLGQLSVQLFREIRETSQRRYFLGDGHSGRQASSASQAPAPSAPAQPAAVPVPPARARSH